MRAISRAKDSALQVTADEIDEAVREAGYHDVTADSCWNCGGTDIDLGDYNDETGQYDQVCQRCGEPQEADDDLRTPSPAEMDRRLGGAKTAHDDDDCWYGDDVDADDEDEELHSYMAGSVDYDNPTPIMGLVQHPQTGNYKKTYDTGHTLDVWPSDMAHGAHGWSLTDHEGNGYEGGIEGSLKLAEQEGDAAHYQHHYNNTGGGAHRAEASQKVAYDPDDDRAICMKCDMGFNGTECPHCGRGNELLQPGHPAFEQEWDQTDTSYANPRTSATHPDGEDETTQCPECRQTVGVLSHDNGLKTLVGHTSRGERLTGARGPRHCSASGWQVE